MSLLLEKLNLIIRTSQFLVKGFAEPKFMSDRNRNGDGVMIYIRDEIRSRLLLKHVFPNDIKGLFIELNFRKCKWLLLEHTIPRRSLISIILITLISH